MARTIKFKIAAGVGTLFGMLLVISIVAFVCINLLSVRTEALLTANYQTIRYCNEMMYAMDDHSLSPATIQRFDQALTAQETNITEQGEAFATQKLRFYFDLLKRGDTTAAVKDSINTQLYRISMLNQQALDLKNEKALQTSATAKLWIAILSVLVIVTGFTLTLNFPGYIANPVTMLTEAIHEISQKNYHKRIHIGSRDEFGQMALAFNDMAGKLDEYERSSMSRLLFEKKRADTIINQMEDAVMGIDAEGKMLFMNHTAETLFHLKSEALIGRYAPDIALHNDLMRTVLKKEGNAPLKIVTDGREHFYIPQSRLVMHGGVSIGEVFTLKDITSFKERDISKTNLLATISHELKTPISSIKMSARLLNDARVGSLNAEQRELMQHINGDAERLLRLTGELLNMTQLETGNIQLKIVKADALQIARNAQEAVQMQLLEQQIQLQTNYPEDNVTVMADAEKTEWVLINLLTNAIKHSPEQAVILLSVSNQENGVVFSVQDAGSGIEAIHLPRIFDRYFKVEKEQVGTGLGLSISREFIEAQGGTISVISEAGAGSTFSFSLNSA